MTSRFRNSVKQNVCVELLQAGFHRSFSELFTLLRSDQDRRAAAEPGSPLSLRGSSLGEQPDKLEAMRLHLGRAEHAERTGSWSVVCDQFLLLARFFSMPEDLWISLYFYHSCADRERGGQSRAATEARACLAEMYLQQDDLQLARQQAEMCVQQAEESGWKDSAGRPLNLRASGLLWKIYSRLADPLLAAGDHSQALTLLHSGYKLTTDSGDKEMEEEAAFQLGLAYQSAGDHDSAKQFFNICMDICRTLEDTDGLLKAYKATAKSLESQGNVDETVRCLQTLVDISRSSGLEHKVADTYLCLGSVYYTMNDYVRAGEYFLQGYHVACEVREVALLERAQVMAASARARGLIEKYGDVESAPPADLQHLLETVDSASD
ncbi:tetratricopeptide repeat protein 29 isoform X1 [Embiotoca jacksoni]|uniref:tetratricopeptide repeat protein 29 isoform X1 n=1 Tax=Embiotoca jacksoni TaxID=100190 RepID=UPI0037037D31